MQILAAPVLLRTHCTFMQANVAYLNQYSIPVIFNLSIYSVFVTLYLVISCEKTFSFSHPFYDLLEKSLRNFIVCLLKAYSTASWKPNFDLVPKSHFIDDFIVLI